MVVTIPLFIVAGVLLYFLEREPRNTIRKKRNIHDSIWVFR